jgi:hypothetical protein
VQRVAESILARIESLVERGRDARARILDDPSLRWVDADLLRSVHAVLGDTIELLSEAERGFSEAETDGEGSAPSSIADLAWLSRGEVAHYLESLRAAEARNLAWKIVSESDSALERADRALLALEGALRALLGLPPTERYRQRLRESLEVRRLYVAVRRSLLQARDPRDATLLNELWALSQQLHAIRTVEAYGVVRVEDRRQLQSLSTRIDAALGDPGPEGEPDRRRLWEELDAFSRLLMAIHERDDLRAHDLALVRQAREELAGEPDALPRELRWLLGRDDELDGLLLNGGGGTGNVTVLLDRLEEELRRRTGG